MLSLVLFALGVIGGTVSIALSCTSGQKGGGGAPAPAGIATLESRVAPSSSAVGDASLAVRDIARASQPKETRPGARPPGVQPLIIRSADLTAEVNNVSSVASEITRIAETSGGYVLSSNAFKTEGERENLDITLKVPSDRFFDTLARIKQAIGVVESERISGEDVTEEYVDLESRLTSLETTYKRLLDLLRLAKNAKEALDVSQALDQVTQQLEQVKGRMRYLRESAAMSTIVVHLRSAAKVLPAVKTEEWSPAHTLKTAFAFSVDSLKGLSSLVIWVVAGFWYIIVIVVAFAVFRATRKRPTPAKL
jgi:hypothetical protein